MEAERVARGSSITVVGGSGFGGLLIGKWSEVVRDAARQLAN